MEPCTLRHPPRGGVWDIAKRTFSPEGCTALDATPGAASHCLRNRTFIFMGDSNIRDLGMAFASFLAGVSPLDAEDHKYDKTRPEQWEAVRLQRSGMAASIFKCGYTHPRYGWTVRVVHRSYHQSWPEFLNITRLAPPRTTLFVEIGIHAIAQTGYLQFLLSNVQSAQANFLHGYVFQPYLDYHCAGAQRSANGEALALTAPLVWMTYNEMCSNRMLAKHHRQILPCQNANKAFAQAASESHFPLLDWQGLSTTNRSLVCDHLSDDGVHYRSWVEHVRARLLASFLCEKAEGQHHESAETHLSWRRESDAMVLPGRSFRSEHATCTGCVPPKMWSPGRTWKDNMSCQVLPTPSVATHTACTRIAWSASLGQYMCEQCQWCVTQISTPHYSHTPSGRLTP